MKRFLGLAWAALTIAAGCGEVASGAVDSGPELRPAAECAPACNPGSLGPPGYDGESVCFDGCNWCFCSAEGPLYCTARSCLDAGAI